MCTEENDVINCLYNPCGHRVTDTLENSIYTDKTVHAARRTLFTRLSPRCAAREPESIYTANELREITVLMFFANHTRAVLVKITTSRVL